MSGRLARGPIPGIGLSMLLLFSGPLPFCGGAEAGTSPRDAAAVLERAAAFFRDRLGVEGTYVWRYSDDGSVREGEGGEVPRSVGWVEPPGTPAVGAAFLRVHQITGRPEWLDAARTVADALVATQLLSGGWFYKIETDPDLARAWCYRSNDPGSKKCPKSDDNPNRNRTVLDDDNTQSVLNFLMWFDQASGQSVPEVREAIEKGLKRLMNAQYDNGAFPVFFTDKIPGQDVPAARKASIPATWSRDWVKPETPPYFVVNDNLPRDIGRLFLNAHRLYGQDDHLRSAMRVGDFLLAAQLPPPQQGWSQQYDRSLQPVWGRRFEPPSVVSYETAGCIEYLIDLFGRTGERQYLDGAASAAKWLESSRLPDGDWARFYELGTNRPLFIDNENRLSSGTTDLIDHYGVKGLFDIPAVLASLRRVEAGGPVAEPKLWISDADRLDPAELEAEARGFVDGIDAEGRWTDKGWIDGERFLRGVFVLSRVVEEGGAEP